MKTVKVLDKAVIGLGFGDEGKGLTVDYLASKTPNPLIIRYSGGQQAGHTVVVGKTKHVFSNFGSGSLRNKDTYWAKHCTVDPIGLIKEYNILKEKGFNPTIYIDDRCPITTPLDVEKNRSLEDFNNHGSCGVGFGSTIEREENFYSLTFMDLYYPFILEQKLKLIGNYYHRQINDVILDFLNSVSEIISTTNIKRSYGIPDNVYTEYIFESSQGLMLDQDIGFFPHVTRSNVGTNRILEMSPNIELYLITRAYQTRHGNGAMSNENLPHNISLDENETNVENEYQGIFRKSLLDLSLLEYAINKDEYIRLNKNKNLVITCLDHIVDEYRLTYEGDILYFNSEEEFVEFIVKILKIKNVYISHSPNSENVTKFE
jgi:adenylosuccinate synthase